MTGSRRWVLTGSLVLNFLLVGLLGGSLIRERMLGAPPVAVRALGFGPFTAALTSADKAALRKAWIARAPDLRAAQSEMRADMATFDALLRAVPFERAALETALSREAERAQARRMLGQSLLLDRMAAMTDAGRSAFADRLEDAMAQRHRGRKP